MMSQMPNLDGELSNTVWVGKAAGWELTLNISTHQEFQGRNTILGSLKSNRGACFLASDTVVSLVDGVVEFAAHSHGSSADRTFIDFKGELSNGSMEGRFTVDASQEEPGEKEAEQLCNLTNQPIVLVRQGSD